METLVVVAQHRNQYNRISSRGDGPTRFGEINCRSFESGAGILPTPLKACSTPVTKQRASPPPFSPQTPSTSVECQSEQNKYTKRVSKSSAVSVPIPINIKLVVSHRGGYGSFGDEFLYSELWAGPAYSNSPPPSSLPIPKFSVRPKRTASLDLPVSASDIDLLPFAKSAPPSPTREHKSFHRDCFNSDDSATKTLCRVLNLDMTDE